jgi:hypothetical protein
MSDLLITADNGTALELVTELPDLCLGSVGSHLQRNHKKGPSTKEPMKSLSILLSYTKIRVREKERKTEQIWLTKHSL